MLVFGQWVLRRHYRTRVLRLRLVDSAAEFVDLESSFTLLTLSWQITRGRRIGNLAWSPALSIAVADSGRFLARPTSILNVV